MSNSFSLLSTMVNKKFQHTTTIFKHLTNQSLVPKISRWNVYNNPLWIPVSEKRLLFR